MNCINHSNRNSAGICRLCTAELCSDCMKIYKNNVICESCVDHIVEMSLTNTCGSAATQLTAERNSNDREAFPVTSMRHKRKSKFLTFLLALFPGLGHIYLGLTRQGIEIMLLFFGSIWATSIWPIPFSFVIPIVVFYEIFHALQRYDRLLMGENITPTSSLFANNNWS